MTQRIQIGNQTSVSCADCMTPFLFALDHGFDVFEWFSDKKWDGDGRSHGWDEADLGSAARAWIRDTGKMRGMRFTVHVPWQANPLHAAGGPLLLRSIDFARDIGAALVNLHLYMDDGAEGFVSGLLPVLRYAAAAGMHVTIENTPLTTPGDFNQTFARLRELPSLPRDNVGMCLDIGHANLCMETHNDFVRYIDRLAPEVPITHVHVHENFGDSDSHLTLFTGPARQDDSGVRAFLKRLRERKYGGALIMEQWPQPPELLVEAATRLRALWGLENEPR
jgi:sugar phosphate isomerase/epimerase